MLKEIIVNGYKVTAPIEIAHQLQEEQKQGLNINFSKFEELEALYIEYEKDNTYFDKCFIYELDKVNKEVILISDFTSEYKSFELFKLDQLKEYLIQEGYNKININTRKKLNSIIKDYPVFKDADRDLFFFYHN